MTTTPTPALPLANLGDTRDMLTDVLIAEAQTLPSYTVAALRSLSSAGLVEQARKMPEILYAAKDKLGPVGIDVMCQSAHISYIGGYDDTGEAMRAANIMLVAKQMRGETLVATTITPPVALAAYGDPAAVASAPAPLIAAAAPA